MYGTTAQAKPNTSSVTSMCYHGDTRGWACSFSCLVILSSVLGAVDVLALHKQINELWALCGISIGVGAFGFVVLLVHTSGDACRELSDTGHNMIATAASMLAGCSAIFGLICFPLVAIPSALCEAGLCSSSVDLCWQVGVTMHCALTVGTVFQTLVWYLFAGLRGAQVCMLHTEGQIYGIKVFRFISERSFTWFMYMTN